MKIGPAWVLERGDDWPKLTDTSHSRGCRVCYEHEVSGSSKHEKISLQLQVKKFFFQPETTEGSFSLVPPMVERGTLWYRPTCQETPNQDGQQRKQFPKVPLLSRHGKSHLKPLPLLTYSAVLASKYLHRERLWVRLLWLQNAVPPKKVAEPVRASTTMPNPCKERINFEELPSVSTCMSQYTYG